jgi:hypothetical protein
MFWWIVLLFAIMGYFYDGRLSHFLTGSVYVPESVEIKPMLRTQARR